MAQLPQGRWTVDVDGDFVVFIIGFRASPSWKIAKALPLLMTMPKMLADLSKDPSKGLLGYQNHGPFAPIIQYWRSFRAPRTVRALPRRSACRGLAGGGSGARST